MGKTWTNAAVWGMLAERWQKTIKAKALSENTERGYLYTARRWAEWLDEQGHDVEPTRSRRGALLHVWRCVGLGETLR